MAKLIQKVIRSIYIVDVNTFFKVGDMYNNTIIHAIKEDTKNISNTQRIVVYEGYDKDGNPLFEINAALHLIIEYFSTEQLNKQE